MPSNSGPEPKLEPPARSVGELKQLLGVTDLKSVTTGELSTPASNEGLDVHPATRRRLNWKPEFYAESNPEPRGGVSKVGKVRVTVTRSESESLVAAGARGGAVSAS